MTTPQQQPPKGPRRSGKKPKPTELQSETASGVGAATQQLHNPPTAGTATKSNNKSQPRKSSHTNSKSQPEGMAQDRPKHLNNHHEKAKATPVKPTAYAGATFQQSPAASALPLPSCYSKSLPTASSMPLQPPRNPIATNRTGSATPADESPTKRETTPCDFLFEAARQAKLTPRAESPATRSGNFSVPNGSPASRSPAPREGDSMFPFELEGGINPGEDGSAFATPYKDRIAALRSTRSTSSGGKTMDENERKAKSDALKKLLMKSSGHDDQRFFLDSAPDMNNPFNARAPYQQVAFLPQARSLVRPSSGPSTPSPVQDHSAYHPAPNFPSMPYQFPPASVHTPKRTTSSRLRNVYGAQSEPEYAELSSDSAITPPISTSRRHTPQHTPHYNSGPVGQPYATQAPVPTLHRAKPSAQQLEDDLRRVLKLDLTSRG